MKTKEKIEKAEQEAWDMIERQRAEAKGSRRSGNTSTGDASSSTTSKPDEVVEDSR